MPRGLLESGQAGRRFVAPRAREDPGSPRLRIALIAPVWFPVPPPAYGGTERVVSTLAEELTGRGHHVTLFAVGGSLTAAELVTTVDEPPRMGGEGSFADDLFHTLSAYRRAAEFDVIHDHTGLGPALGAMLRRMPPVVHTLHGPWTATSRRFYGLVDDRIALVAISRSQAMANPQVRYGGIVYNGIDLGAHPFSADKHDYLAYVGRVSPEKGTATAVEVARGAGRPLKMVVKRRERPVGATGTKWSRRCSHLTLRCSNSPPMR